MKPEYIFVTMQLFVLIFCFKLISAIIKNLITTLFGYIQISI